MQRADHRAFCSTCHKFRVVHSVADSGKIICIECVSLPQTQNQLQEQRFKKVKKNSTRAIKAPRSSDPPSVIAHTQRILNQLRTGPESSRSLASSLNLKRAYLNTLLRLMVERDNIIKVKTLEKRQPDWYALPEDLEKCQLAAATDTDKVYAFICKQPDLWASEIARQLRMNFGTVHYATRRLIEQDLIEQVPSPDRNIIKLRSRSTS